MATSYLLRLKPRGLHFNGRGKSFHFGIFLNCASNFVEQFIGAWFKGILSNVKQTLLERPWFQKSISRETSDAKVDTEAYDVTATEHASDTVGGNAFKESDVNAISEVCKMHSNSDNVALGDVQTIVQPPEAVRVSDGNELRTSVTDVTVENSLKMNQSRKISDMFVEKLKNDVERFQGVITATSVQRPTASTNSGKNRTSSKRSLRVKELLNVMMRKMNDPTGGEMAGNVQDTLEPTESLKGKKMEKNIKTNSLLEDMKGLFGEEQTINAQERTILDATDQRTIGGFLKNDQSAANFQDSDHSKGGLCNTVRTPANLHKSDVKRRHTLLKQILGEEQSSSLAESISEKEDSSLNLANSNYVKSGSNSNGSHPVSREEVESHLQTCFLGKEGSKDNKVLVRFLTKNVEKQNILEAFSDCGPIVNIEELSSPKQSPFKDFLVHFETSQGSETSLKKNDLNIMEAEALVESISSEDSGSAISIPDLIGDPEATSSLVKNPIKTVKVKHLPEDISSQQLKEALAFCHSNISNIFFVSTSSVVRVEFETEDAKERALAQRSILVSERKLSILRIDAPMTTMVRISNINFNSKFQKICNSYAKVKCTMKRITGVVDVHFKLAEWPNMLNIVNSLNGLEVDENWWVALPAPVFPPVILRALWCRPEGRQHVNAVIYKLSREVEKPISTT
ncbi:uncharacterized protein LOC120144261 [Hibiscus syriacus]|uniref:uncharacterized protein LOC120144261 n=1 Tax=Hibiscus syriacus TaxID=106335 RepID=UPI0019216536|nr:uncharacterized protein LOC120144261 [Hibiscus syriacus]